MAAKWSYLCVAVLVAIFSRYSEASTLPICYPPGTIDFLQGLGVRDLPAGVTESCDSNDAIAYEVDKSASIYAHFKRVIDKGYHKQQPDDEIIVHEWPGDFSVNMRVRMWEAADIMNIYDSHGGHRFGISIGNSDGIRIKINGMVPVQISTVDAVDGQFHRITMSLLGSTARVNVSGSDVADCGTQEVTELRLGTSERAIPVSRGLVVLGREGDSAIETPQVTIQQLIFRLDPVSAYTCRYEIKCPSPQPSHVPGIASGIDRNYTKGDKGDKRAKGSAPDGQVKAQASTSPITTQPPFPSVKTEIPSNDTCEGLNYKSSGEELMRKFLRRMFQLPPGVVLTSKQFSFIRKKRVVRVWFRDADTDKNNELSDNELLDYASSLFERNYISEECSLWLMKKCLQGQRMKMDLRALRECFGVATRENSDP